MSPTSFEAANPPVSCLALSFPSPFPRKRSLLHSGPKSIVDQQRSSMNEERNYPLPYRSSMNVSGTLQCLSVGATSVSVSRARYPSGKSLSSGAGPMLEPFPSSVTQRQSTIYHRARPAGNTYHILRKIQGLASRAKSSDTK